jgi:hypothetical protein
MSEVTKARDVGRVVEAISGCTYPRQSSSVAMLVAAVDLASRWKRIRG